MEQRHILSFDNFELISEQSKTEFVLGDKNVIIKKYQQALKNLGFNLGTSGKNKDGVDGDFGKLTQDAVIAFQKSKKLTPSGKLDSSTIKALIPSTKMEVPKISLPKLPGDYTTAKSDTFSPYSKDTISQKYKWIGKSVQEAVKVIGSVSKRAYEQLIELRKSDKLDGRSFIIVNKDSAIACLFDGDYKLVAKSSITTGKTKDTGETETNYEDWANISLSWGKDKDPKIKAWIKNNQELIKSDGKIDYEKYQSKGGQNFPYSYAALKQTKTDITKSGVYGVGSGKKSHYVGAPDITNTYALVSLKTGEDLPGAVHAYSDEERGKALRKASTEDVEKVKDYTRLGAGCVNVDRNFILSIQKFNPSFVIILPDKGGKVDITIVPMKTWTEKIIDLGNKVVSSFSNLFN